MPLFLRLLLGQFIFLFGSIWALVGTPFLFVAAWAAYAKPKDDKVLVLVFGLLGLVFAGAGWTMVALAVRKASRQSYLLQSGTLIGGTVVEVLQSQNVRINNRYPWYVVYKFSGLDGVQHKEESPYLPSGAEGRWKPGDSLPVLCDPSDPTVFMPDVEGLRQPR